VKALSHGTPVIDGYSTGTFDLALSDGQYDLAKAPGVALLAVGPTFVLDRTGALEAVVSVTGIPREDADLWALAVIVCALVAALTLVLVARLGDEVAKGCGVAAAVTLGSQRSSCPLRLSSSHTSRRGARVRRVRDPLAPTWAVAALAAGTLAGAAVTVEYPLAMAAVMLGVYAVTAGDWLRRGRTYVAGLAMGVSPLLAYNTWALRLPLHFPYEDALPIDGRTRARVRGMRRRRHTHRTAAGGGMGCLGGAAGNRDGARVRTLCPARRRRLRVRVAGRTPG
jgi:hypothetical protein